MAIKEILVTGRQDRTVHQKAAKMEKETSAGHTVTDSHSEATDARMETENHRSEEGRTAREGHTDHHQMEKIITGNIVLMAIGNRLSTEKGHPVSIAISAKTGDRHTAREGSHRSAATESQDSRRLLREENLDSAERWEQKAERSVRHRNRCSALRTRAESDR